MTTAYRQSEAVKVPNQFPVEDPGNVRLAIIGECPGLDEVSWRMCPQGHGFAGMHWESRELKETKYCPDCGSSSSVAKPSPFVGPSGKFLNWCLRQAGTERRRVFVGNCAQSTLSTRELENKNNGALAAGQFQLEDDLRAFDPTCVLCLGNTALRVFHPDGWRETRHDDEDDGTAQTTLGLGEARNASSTRKPKWCYRITDWRGSIFESDFLLRYPSTSTETGVGSGGRPLKCVAAYHPAAVLRQPEWTPFLQCDIKRGVEEAGFRELRLPERSFDWQNSAADLCGKLQALAHPPLPLGFDIEGYATTGVTDMSFAASSSVALWVPLKRANGQPWWSPSDQQMVMEASRDVLEDAAVPKICHNSLYESFVLAWAHGIGLRGVLDDTMLLWHELYPELDKALEVPVSILTRQPYWKHGRHARTDEERAEYNCIDSCATLEIRDIMLGNDPITGQPFLTPRQVEHYRTNMTLLEPCLWQMRRGIPYDRHAADELKRELTFNAYSFQGELDRLAGILPPTLAEVINTICNARKRKTIVDWPGVVEAANPTWKKAL